MPLLFRLGSSQQGMQRMNDAATTQARLFDRLEAQPADALLAIIGLVKADERPHKIDLGVGVYKDAVGTTPILRAVKAAELILNETQETKAYLGSQGDTRFVELMKGLVFGEAGARADNIVGVQTPGGCGALRLGAELIVKADPGARIFVGQPTWPNHGPLIGCAGVEMIEHPYYDPASSTLLFDEMVGALEQSRSGDLVLVHGCCHNPTGADLDEAQWAEVTRLVAERGLIPFIDIAYQGFGRGLDEDAAGLRTVLDACDEVVIAQSCDKNFSVYRDRVGSLLVKTGSAAATATAMAHVFQRAREMWSMPPDHGAAAVRIILDDPELKCRWLVELEAMRTRINSVRAQIAAADPRLAFIGRQFGMFSMLPLSKDKVVALRKDHAIYMADSGRFNVVGMSDAAVDRFTGAVIEALDG
jgi:aromatic-amino-acid transaminase